MDIPSIKILSSDLLLLDEIDLYTSLQYTRSWQGIGSFELHIIGNPQSIQTGNIIMLGGDGHRAGVIRAVTKKVGVNGIETTATGQTLNGFLSQRLLLQSENSANCGYFAVPTANAAVKTVPAETILKNPVIACIRDVGVRNMPITVATNQKRGIETNWISRYEILSDVLQAASEYCDCGWEVYIDLSKRQFIFDMVEGVDRSVSQNKNSRVILSRDFESIDSLTYSIDQSNYKNVAYCGGVGEDFDRLVVAVTADENIPEGFNRFEIFEDCGTLEAAETDTALSIYDEGRHKLESYKLTETLTAEISQSGAFEYLKDWNLGDLVTVRDKELNLQQDLRITEVTESYEADSIKLTVRLGTSPLRLGRVIRRIRPSIR